MRYCVECGTKLVDKELEGEGLIPFCPNCNAYRFPIFNTAVSMIVRNPKGDILLIKQYGSDTFILVAGYVSKGECAEDTVIREVREETDLTVTRLQFNRSKYFAPSNTLMLNFTAYVEDSDFRLTNEVDYAQWFTPEEAKRNIRDKSLAQYFLMQYLKNEPVP